MMLAQPTGTSAEAFRMLRTNLDFARLEGDDVRVILVTSAVEEEGKSTTAANLALAEARGGRRVVLVDLDLRRPYLDRFFGLHARRGDHQRGAREHPAGAGAAPRSTWRSARRRRTDERRCRRRTGMPTRGSLDVLVSGPLPPDPGEFVGTRRLAEILARLRAAYDLVIVDTPPVLRVGDAMALSAQADGMLVVTRLNVVRRPMLRELRRAARRGAGAEARLRRDGIGRRRRGRLRVRTATRTAATGTATRSSASAEPDEEAEGGVAAAEPASAAREADRV